MSDDASSLGPVSRMGAEPVAEFFRYAVAGGIATTADTGIYIYACESLRFHYLLSAIFGFIAGTFITYTLSQLFVFRRAPNMSRWQSFSIFALIGLVGLGLTHLLLYAQIDWLGFGKLPAKLVAVGLVFAWNFIARKVLVFSLPANA